MNASAWERWSPLSGIVSVVLLLVGLLMGQLPGGADSDQKMANYVNDHGHRVTMSISAYVMVFGALAFLWFLGSLRTRLLAAEGMPARVTTIAFSAGVTVVILLIVMAGSEGAMVSPISFGKEHSVGPSISYIGWFGVWAFIFAMLAAAALAIAVAAVAFRTRVFARWLVWLSVLAAIVLLFSFAFLPAAAFVIWTVAVSIAMIRPGPVAATPPA
jgi:hypothetical protein